MAINSLLRRLRARSSDRISAAARSAVEALEQRIFLTAAPTISGNATTYEGVAYGITLAAHSTNTPTSWDVVWGDGATQQVTTGSLTSVSLSHTYVDGDGSPGTSRTISATVTDADGSYAVTKALTVSNLPPSLMVSRAASADEGSTFTLHLASSDLGTDTISSWDLNWGDGSGTNHDGAQHVAGNPSSVAHVYADGTVNYAITASATDEDGTYTAATNLDSNFGNGGIATTDFGTTSDYGRAAVVQSDGKVIAAGESNGNFALVRYNTDGFLDSGFGTSGKVTTSFPSSVYASSTGSAVTLQTVGGVSKILVAGSATTSANGTPRWAVARYNSDGTLDHSFGEDDGSGTGTKTGLVTTAVTTSLLGGTASAVTVDNSNRILVAGGGFNAVSGISAGDFVLARYSTDGALDTTFGTAGEAKLAFSTGSGGERINAVKVQSDGKIVVAGQSAPNLDTSPNFALARYNDNGTLDTSFGTSGKLTTDFGAVDSGFGLVLQSGGAIVVAGYTQVSASTGNFALARYTSSGSLDTTFGSAGTGKVTTDFGGGEQGLSLGSQSDGKLLVAGYSFTNTSARNFAVARYSSDGVLDSTFGVGGKLTTGIGVNAEAHGIVIRPDGRIVVVGFANGDFGAVNYNFAAAAYHPSNNVTISNVAPALSITGASTGVAGENYTITLSATDPGLDTLSQWVVNWGDGKSNVLTGAATTASHVYGNGIPTATVSATAGDEDVDGNGYQSNTLSVNLLPEVPQLSAQGANEVVELDWSEVPGASSYNVYRTSYDSSGNPVGGESVYEEGVTSAQFTDADVTNGELYSYRVAGSNDAGEGALSATATALAGAPTSAWHFEEGTGNTTQSEAGDIATFFGSPTAGWWTNGQSTSGKALNFDGNNYVGTGGVFNPSASFTASAWVRVDGQSTDQTLIGNKQGGGFQLGIFGGKLELEVSNQSGSQLNRDVSGGTELRDGQWHHVAGVYSASGQFIECYVDGVMERRMDLPSGWTFAAGTGDLVFGSSATFGHSLQGKLDEVGLYDRALSSAEVASLSTAQPPAKVIGLSADGGDGEISLSWPVASKASNYSVYRGTSAGSEILLAGGVSTNAFVDSSVAYGSRYFYKVVALNAYGPADPSAEVSAASAPTGEPISVWHFNDNPTGSSYNSATTSDGGQVGQFVGGVAHTYSRTISAGTALYFDGSGYVDAGQVFNPDDVVTVAAWIKLAGSEADQKIVDNQTAGGFQLGVVNGKLELVVSDAANHLSSNHDASGGTDLRDGQWHHVAGVYSKAGGYIRTYVDGGLDREKLTGIGDLDAGTGHLIFGRSGQQVGGYFHGALENLRLYDSALSAAQIAGLALNHSAMISGASTVAEGSAYLLSLQADESTTWSINWGDGQSETVSNQLSTAHYYADDGAHSIIVTANGTMYGTIPVNALNVSVVNVSPSLTATPQASVERATTTTFDLATIIDPGFVNALQGTQERFTATVDWGDGSGAQPGTIALTPGSAGVSTIGKVRGSHRYDAPGAYEISISVGDDDGGVAPTVYTTVTVAGARVYQVPGQPGEVTRVAVKLTKKPFDAKYYNELGLFIVDGPEARVGGLLPDDPGYAHAALTDASRRVALPRFSLVDTVYNIDLPAGTYLAFYFVQDSTTSAVLQANSSNLLSLRPHAFFLNAVANPDNHFAHFRRSELAGGGVQYNCEDKDYGGDQDFNDLVFTLDAVAQPTPSISLTAQGVSTDGVDLCWEFPGIAPAGYNIYRAPSADGAFTRVNASLVQDTQFADRGLTGATTYYYKLEAVDASGNVAALSNIANATTLTVSAVHGWYSNDFEFDGPAGHEWSNTNKEVTPVGARRFLGQFKNDRVTLNLDQLTAHDTVTITFDLYINGSWDGESQQYGPDIWSFGVDGGPTFVHDAFLNGSFGYYGHPYPDPSAGEPLAPVAINVLGYAYDVPRDAVYHLTYSFAHTADNVAFWFEGTSNEREAWGIDNIRVSALIPAPPRGLSAIATSADSIAVDWSPNAEADLIGYDIYRSTSPSTTWTKLNTDPLTSTHFADSGLNPSTYYTYRIVALNDTEGQSEPSKSALARTARPGASAPASPSVLTATAISSSEIDLDWNDVTPPVAGYYLYRQDPIKGVYVRVNNRTIFQSSWVDVSGVRPGTTYLYKVTAADSLGAESSPFGPATATTPVLGAPTPPAPQNVHAIATSATQIHLDWNDSTDPNFAGFVVYRFNTLTGTYDRLNSEPILASELNDTDVGPSTTYLYKVSAFNTFGVQSPLAGPVSARTDAPDAAPLPPRQGTIRATSQGLLLDWADNAEPDLAGYLVSRSDAPDGEFVPLHQGNLSQSTFEDTTAPRGVESFYQIVAVDQAGNRSDPLRISFVRPVADTIAPASPANLRAVVIDTEISLRWDVNSEPDIRGYNVYRSDAPDGNFVLLNQAGPLDVAGYDDAAAPLGATSYYRVVAVDLDGNASAPATISESLPANGEPAAPTGLIAQALSGGRIRLVWNANTEVNRNGYFVYRLNTVTNSYAKISDRITEREYIDDGLPVSTTFTYKVSAVNTSAVESALSLAASATTADGVRPPAPQGLVASATSASLVHLLWTAGTGLAGYNVYRSQTVDGTYDQLNSALVTTSSYDDTTVSAGTTYFFKVVAVQTDGDESDRSIAASATTPSAPAQAPTLKFTSPAPSTTPWAVDRDTPVRGVVDDLNNDLVAYSLVAKPVATGDPITLASSTTEVGSAGGVDGLLTTLQPTLLPQGVYTLILSANDAAGHSAQLTQEIEVKTELKLGNFSLPATDLTINAPELPITVSRVYDTLQANEEGDFGPGWRMELPDINLESTARQRDTRTVSDTAAAPSYYGGDVVSMTLPGGARYVFRFEPEALDENLLSQIFKPKFVPISGTYGQLSVGLDDIWSSSNPGGWYLERGGDGQFYDLFYDNFGPRGYNPSLAKYGRYFTLTTPDGTKYTIDPQSGKVRTVADLHNNTLDYTNPNRIASSTGVVVTLERDGVPTDSGTKNYITGIVDPEGHRIQYRYNSTGELVGVVERQAVDGQEVKTSYAYNGPKPHYMTEVDDARGVKVLSATYASNGELQTLQDVYNRAVPFSGEPFISPTTVRRVTDLANNTTEYVYNDRGAVLREIRPFTDQAGQTRYKVIAREFVYWDIGDNDPIQQKRESVPFATDAATRFTAAPTVWASTSNYDPLGNLTSEIDARGRTTRCSNYTGFGRPGQVVDSIGNATTFTFDPANGDLLWTENALGERTRFAYNSRGDATATYRVFSGTAETIVSSATYNGPNGRMDTSTDAAGVTQFYTYDGNGNLEQERYRWVNPSQASDIRLVETITAHDDSDRVVGVTEGRQIRESDGAIISAGVSTTTEYNPLGSIRKTTDDYGRDTFYDYDSRGKLIRTRYPGGTETRTSYDIMGRVEWTVDRYKPGSTDTGYVGSRIFYDKLGRVWRTQRLDGVLIVVETDPNVVASGQNVLRSRLVSSGAVRSTNMTGFDEAGRTQSITGPDGRSTTYTYFDDGRVKTVTDALQHTTAFAYNETYNATNPALRRRWNVVTDARSNSTQTEVDALGRSIKTTYADGTFAEIRYARTADDDTVTTIRQRRSTDPEVASDSHYDLSGRLTAVELPDPDGTAPFDRPRWEYEYDQFGNQTVIRDPLDDKFVSGGQNRETRFSYDALGRRTGRTLPGGQSESQTYDEHGRVSLTTDFDGQSTRYTYDDNGAFAGLLREKQFFTASQNPANDAPAEHFTYSYDPLGRLERVAQFVGSSVQRTTTYAYDSDGNLLDQLAYGAGKDPQSSAADEAVHYAYDLATGRHIRTNTDSASSPVTDTRYGYDELGRLKSVTSYTLNGQTPDPVTSSLMYDANGNATATTLPNTVYTYDVVGNLDSISLPNGVVTKYSYDSLNRLDVETIRRGSTNIASYDYDVTPDGQRNHVTENSYSGSSVTTTNVDWTYDLLNRLTGEHYDPAGTADDFTATYSYDQVGNRLSKTVDKEGTANDETVTYDLYDANDRLGRETSSLSGETTYEYDNNGSLTKKTHGSDTTYHYDLRNELAGVDATGDGVQETTYAYDGDGDRISQSANGTATYYLIDRMNPTGYAQTLQESSTFGGTPVRSYVLGTDVLGQADVPGDVSYLLYDGHGSTRLLADPSGQILSSQHYNYDAFGNALGFDASTASTKLLYSGERIDTTDQYYLRARSYDPRLGRFSSTDTNEGHLSTPGTLHKYLYCHGDPINFADPSGHSEFSLSGRLVVGGITGLLLGSVIGAVGGAATGAYLHIVQFHSFDGVLDAAERGAIYGAIAGAVIGASAVNPVALAATLSLSFGIGVGQSIPILLDPNIRPQTKVAILAFLALQGTLSRGAIVKGLTGPRVVVPPPTATFASTLQESFASKVGQATDGVLGGFIKADGSADLLPFTRAGIPDHATGVAQGIIPQNATGGFSVIVDSNGQATAVLFRSALNSADNDFYLPSQAQQAIIDALPKAPGFKVLK